MDYAAGRELIKDLLAQRFDDNADTILSAEYLDSMCRMYYDLFMRKIMPFHPDFKVETGGRRDSRSAGKCVKKRGGDYVISFNPHALLHMSEEDRVIIDGREVRGLIDCVMAVAEHELTHMAEFALYGSTSHGKRFKLLGARLFDRSPTALTKYRTAGMIDAEDNMRQSNPYKVGDRVVFDAPTYGEVAGVITRIVKRATVIAERGRCRKGTKFYVPLAALRRLD
ncbi:MAG: hypothetical protein K2M44_00365 [Clostridia bacterium]|nr:hypothetical protein [Clostridia bacterium]